MMETIKIKFGNLWPGFNTENNFITRILTKKFVVEISDDPDFYFFTHPYNGSRDYLKYKCHRIFLGWENERADWTMCDYVLDSDFISNNPRHKRYPIWASWNLQSLIKPNPVAEPIPGKKFCCMLVSNANAKERIDFFHKLSAYKKVDSAGRHLNNVGHAVDNKMDFIKDYKFVISFENSSYPGYTTEKLIEPMLVNSIPIYWGNTSVAKDFNTKSFINVNDFKRYEDAIDYIIELDNNHDMYMNLMAEPWFNSNVIPQEFTEEKIMAFFDFIIKDSKVKKPVAKSMYRKYAHKGVLFKQKIQWELARVRGKRSFRIL